MNILKVPLVTPPFIPAIQVRNIMNMPRPNAIYICPGDPYCAPRGGQTAFAIQALNAFGSQLALVSPDERQEKPVGSWFPDQWHGESIWRFNIGSYAPSNKSRRPLIPRRIIFRHLIGSHMSEIRKIQTRNLFCDSPELLGILARYDWDSFCYRFAGLNNPVGVSRYPFLRFMSGWFHRRMMHNLDRLKPDALLASADHDAIAAFQNENADFFKRNTLSFFPTRFDEKIFKPGDIRQNRRELGISNHDPILIFVGRLCWVKGWLLALEAIKILKEEFPGILLIIVGNGEDRSDLETYANELGVSTNVRLEGFLPPNEVQRRLVAADLYLCTSHREGWSVAMTEALGCAKVCVSTAVSGAREMIKTDVNGVVVTARQPQTYADAIRRALRLKEQSDDAETTSLEISKRFSLANFACDWGRLWTPLAPKSR